MDAFSSAALSFPKGAYGNTTHAFQQQFESQSFINSRLDSIATKKQQ
ncbi:hypothetical protein THAOC_06344, partial [Thalassiosira oceanica]